MFWGDGLAECCWGDGVLVACGFGFGGVDGVCGGGRVGGLCGVGGVVPVLPVVAGALALALGVGEGGCSLLRCLEC